MKFLLVAAVAQLAAAGLVARSPCSPLEVVIDRGTGEPGKYGVVVGDNIVADLASKMPTATAFNVAYPANADPDSALIGSNMTFKHIQEQIAACPQQKFALVGYSQGAAVLHIAALQMTKDMVDHISSIVTFGDPASPGPKSTTPLDKMKNIPPGLFVASGGKPPPAKIQIPHLPDFPEPLKSRTKYNCHSGDPVCMPGDDFMQHILYMEDSWIPDSVDFIIGKFKSG